MSLLYILLTFLMFADCVVLVLLVLLQLPKKEAGAGMAFGAGATDALFGAGSGNVLTKITKYAAGIFFSLAIIMAMVASQNRPVSHTQALTDALKNQSSTAPISSGSSTSSSPSGSASPSGNNSGLVPLLSNLPPAQTTAPAPATNK
jgi:preprotein translocase subunit SecG